MPVDGPRQARIRHHQRPPLVVPHGVDDGNELRRDPAFGQRQIHGREHLGRARLNRRMGTQNTADECGINGRRRAFAADIADRDPQPRQRIGNEVVEIAADGAGGKKLGLNFEMLHLGKRMRQQAKLQFARQCQIVFQPLLLPRDVLVEARVFNGNRHLRRERGQGALVILGEITAAGVLQIEDSDDLLLIDQRDRQLRARLRIHRDVALTLGHVRHQNPFLGLRRVSHHSPAKRDVVLQMQPFLEA